jgi:DNA-binding transcriptional ArsR family regulator
VVSPACGEPGLRRDAPRVGVKLSEEIFREGLAERTVSSVVFRNMSSEENPAPGTAGADQEPAANPDQEPAARPDASDPDPDPDSGADLMRLTDTKAMRALAHPVRLALLEILGMQTLTATQASELLGESPANCAFHLRTLAKYGFVEEAGGGRGRERPWRSAHKRIRVSSADQTDPQAKLAADALGRLWDERWLERIRRVMAARAWPAGWESATTSGRIVRFLTPQEATEAGNEVRAVLDRYSERRDHPELRPADALPVEFIIFGYPTTELTYIPDGQA